MEENPDFDYEMDPQAAYTSFQGSAEEAMDDAGSVSVTMSDAGMQPELHEKAAIDVDFQDSVNASNELLNFPTSTIGSLSAAPAYVQEESMIETVQLPSANHEYEPEPVEEVGIDMESKAHPEIPLAVLIRAPPQLEKSAAVPTDTASPPNDELKDAEQWQAHGKESHSQHKRDEENNRQKDAEHATLPEGAPEEVDQLEHEEEETFKADIEEGEGGEGIHENGIDGHYYSEEHDATTVRVSFNGQDFVMWSSQDISAFLTSSRSVQETDQAQEAEELLLVEAPALEVQSDVLWQPLDSLFASLREKKALGDFLDESQELHLVFPDLTLEVTEDNLYCRELTLDDLLQLHHGLGLATSLHIQVSERPRFITRYNELAQHVAGILGNQLQHSNDDSEEEEFADPVQRGAALLRNVEGPVGTEAKEATSSIPPMDTSAGAIAEESESRVISPGAGAGHHSQTKKTGSPISQAIANKVDGADTVTTLDASDAGPADNSSLQVDASEFTEVPASSSDAQGKQRSQSGTILSDTIDDRPVKAGLSNPNALKVDVHELREDDEEETARQRPNQEPLQLDGVIDHSSQAHKLDDGVREEVEEVDEIGEDEAEEDGDVEEQEDVNEEEDDRGGEDEGESAVWEEEAYEEEAEHEEALGDVVSGDEEGEHEEVGEDAAAQVEGEGQYTDEAGDYGEEFEQTFYTTINDGSDAEQDAEEDELDDQAEGAEGTDGQEEDTLHENPSKVLDSGYVHEVDSGDQAWQGESEVHTETSLVELPTDEPPFVINSARVLSPEEAEEQIVDYTEEPSEAFSITSLHPSAASTYEQLTAQRKRGLAEEDDENAQYEEEDYEADPKRAKVD